MAVPTLVLALAAVLAGPPPEKPEADLLPPSFSGIHVLVRTADGLVTGHDLRYQDGEFGLRQEKGEVTLPEGKVVEAQFLDLPHDEMRDPVVGLALRVAYLRRAGLLKRFVLLQRFRDGLFLRPEESVAEAFPRVVPALWHPDLAALLCVETALRCQRDPRPQQAAALFEAAEAASKERPEHAFVYGLMRVAATHEAVRPEEEQEALRQLAQKYPDHARDLARFRVLLRDEGDRPFPPRPPKGPHPKQ